MSELDLTPSQAHYVLSKLVGDRKVTRRDVSSYLKAMQQEIEELEGRLEELRSLRAGKGGRKAAAKKGRAGATGKAAAPKKRKSKITPEQRASRKLQGVYMSLLRQIPKARRAKYQRLAKDKNRQAAVDAMKSVLKA